MNLKHYTSKVPAITSMARIEKCLVEAGATDISKKYENQVYAFIRRTDNDKHLKNWHDNDLLMNIY